MWLDKMRNKRTFPDEKSLWVTALMSMLMCGGRYSKMGDEYCYRLGPPCPVYNEWELNITPLIVGLILRSLLTQKELI